MEDNKRRAVNHFSPPKVPKHKD